ncbi:MAG: dihydroorotase [Gammaproteobacteria bacterium]|nr:dihydroorotase [Gammaproteobacteria bacterium]MDH5692254.1 dihydroorotase [Gammaproteobacteria bacterium]
MSLRIKGGRVIDPANSLDQVVDIVIENGKIASVGAVPKGFRADQTIDAKDKIVCPGFVDLRARLREPGLEYKGTIESETRAAAASGITTLCCPPDTTPVCDNPSVVELIYQRAAASRKARVLCMGALTVGLEGRLTSEMKALADVGCVGVSNGYKPVRDTLVMRRAMEYASGHNLTVFIHAEDTWLRGGGVAHEGPVSTRLGLAPIPEFAETIAVARELALIEHTGARAHFCGLSTARAVNMITQAQEEGMPVTADVNMHNLFLTEMDLLDFNAQCHVRPPLRSQRDREGLRAGLLSGAISAITTDHQPHDSDAKFGPISETEPGISGLETFLLLGLRLVKDKVLTLSQLISLISSGPAQILGLPVGNLSVDSTADLCIFDPEISNTVDAKRFLSRGQNTPFDGWELDGRVTHTILDGQLVFTAE